MRKKVRTALTLLSLFIAFFLFGVLVAVETAFLAGVDLAGLDRMLVIHKVSLIMPLPKSYLARIEAVEGVRSVAYAVWFGGVYQDPKNFFARMAVDPEKILEAYPEIELPEEQKEAWLENRVGAIAGRPIAERFGWEIGDRIPIRGDIWRQPDDSAWEFVLEGIYDAKEGFDKTQFFFHYDYLAETIPGADGIVGWYIARIEDPESSAEVAERIDRLFANSPAETKTSTEKAFAQGFANQIGDIGKIVTSVLVVVFFTLLLVAGNTMAQSVRERTGELGVLKTLGFSDRQVMQMVLGESYLLTLLGGGLGLGAIALLVANVDKLGELGNMIETSLPTVYMPRDGLAVGVLLLVLVGFAAGAVPALKALRLNIVDALRRT
jgi:putative ABC transport system permease protein